VSNDRNHRKRCAIAGIGSTDFSKVNFDHQGRGSFPNWDVADE
jgi:hypothetical protein